MCVCVCVCVRVSACVWGRGGGLTHILWELLARIVKVKKASSCSFSALLETRKRSSEVLLCLRGGYSFFTMKVVESLSKFSKKRHKKPYNFFLTKTFSALILFSCSINLSHSQNLVFLILSYITNSYIYQHIMAY